MHLPHLPPFSRHPLLFITCCTAARNPLLANPLAHSILEELWRRSADLDGWHVGHYLLMPDHVHLFARPADSAKPPAAWIKTWKSVSSRQLGANHQATGPVWQPDYFDHFVRSVASYQEKWDYVQDNPVRKGLCTERARWPYQGTLQDLKFEQAG